MLELKRFWNHVWRGEASSEWQNMKDLEFTTPAFGSSPIKFLKEAKRELHKVVWPKKQEVVKLTLIVISLSTVVGLYLGGLDFLFTKIIEVILKW